LATILRFLKTLILLGLHVLLAHGMSSISSIMLVSWAPMMACFTKRHICILYRLVQIWR